MRHFVMGAIAAALFANAAAGAGKAESPERSKWDLIAFETKSWGRKASGWALVPGGSGSWSESVDRPGGNFADYDIRFNEIEVGTEAYAELEALLAKLPDPAPDANNCANFMTDMPYGTLRLTRGATTIEIAWNAGCRDARYLQFMALLKAADEKVSNWGKAGKFLRTERSLQTGN